MNKFLKYITLAFATFCVLHIANAKDIEKEIKADINSAESKIEKEVKSIEDITYSDFEKTIEDAEDKGKILMMEFTGNDWCPPCKYLHKNIITTKEFFDYAKDNILRVAADVDVGRNFKSKEYSDQYAQLAEIFKVSGFPTVIFINPKTKEAFKIVGGVESVDVLVDRIKKLKNPPAKAEAKEKIR